MPDLELRQLRYLVAVAEAGSITRAAHRLLITQPALSRAIRALERAVGVPLFVRRPHATELTEAGSALLTEAYDIIGRTDRAVRRIRGGARTLRVSASGCDILTAVAARHHFETDHPAVRVEIVPYDWRVDAEELRSGEADLGLVRDCQDRRGLRLRGLAREQRLLVLSDRHPYAEKTGLTVADLRDEPIACLAGMTPAERAHWAGADTHPGPWRAGAEVGSVSELITELKLGRTIAFVHRSAMPDTPVPGIAARPVGGLSPSRLEVAVAEKNVDPVAAAFAARLARVR